MAASLAKMRESLRRSHSRVRVELSRREHTMVASTAAAAVGLAETKGYKLPSVVGVDGAVVWGTVALLLADRSSGDSQRMLQSLGDGLLCIGAYRLGRAVGGQAIAGSDAEAMEAVLGDLK